jgi:hypothetical protein
MSTSDERRYLCNFQQSWLATQQHCSCKPQNEAPNILQRKTPSGSHWISTAGGRNSSRQRLSQAGQIKHTHHAPKFLSLPQEINASKLAAIFILPHCWAHHYCFSTITKWALKRTAPVATENMYGSPSSSTRRSPTSSQRQLRKQVVGPSRTWVERDSSSTTDTTKTTFGFRNDATHDLRHGRSFGMQGGLRDLGLKLVGLYPEIQDHHASRLHYRYRQFFLFRKDDFMQERLRLPPRKCTPGEELG